LPINLPAEVEVDCRSLKIKSSEGTRICVAAGPAIKNGRGKRIAKAHFPARGFKADDAPLDFLASILIFRVLPRETQARSQFGTATQNIPELGIWGSIPLTEY
jgi:hypothetical protein